LYARSFLEGAAYPDWALNDRQVWFPLGDNVSAE